MAKTTLLEITQSILSSLDGEAVNSINDTVESQQVAGFVRDSYQTIVSTLTLPSNLGMIQLSPSNDVTKPTVMYLPETVNNINWIKYDKRLVDDPGSNFQDVQYLDLDTFLQRMYNDNIGYYDTVDFTHSMNGMTFRLSCRNNQSPTYYTSPDNKTLFFDSYDAAVDDTLMASKTVCFGELVQTFRMEDDFIPNLDEKQMSLLLNEAKSQSFIEQKQTSNPKAEQRAKKGWVLTQKNKIRIPNYQNNKRRSGTDFGRR